MNSDEMAWPTGERDKILRRIRKSERAGRIVQGGNGWDDETQRGCAISCSLGEYNLSEYAKHVTGDCMAGLQLAHLVDCLHEYVTPEFSKTWPRRFATALLPGTHPRRCLARWFFWLLSKECPSVEGVNVIGLWQRILESDEPSRQERIRACSEATHMVAGMGRPRWQTSEQSYERQAEALLVACDEEGKWRS